MSRGPQKQRIEIPTDTATLAYLAGILDGEGTVRVQRHKFPKQKKVYLMPSVSIVNTDESLILWIQKTLGTVNIYRIERTSPYRDKFVVDIRRRADIIAFLSATLPYLIVKRKKAEDLLTLLLTPGSLTRHGA